MRTCYIKELLEDCSVGQHIADFPIPDDVIGRPLCIFDKENSRIVGVELKDPYHIGKNFIALVELTDEELKQLG